MKTRTVVMIVGGGVVAYLAYQWWTGQQAAAAAVAAPATGTTGTDATGTDTTGTDTGAQPMLDPYYGAAPDQGIPGAWPGGTIMQVRPPGPPVPVPYGQPGHALAFGAWFAQLPAARRAQVAKLPWANKLAIYQAYSRSYNARVLAA